MDTMKDTTMQHVTDVVIEEVKLAAEHPLKAPVIVRADVMLGILMRLEAAEKERDALRTALQHETDCLEAAKEKIDALCARIEEMEKQEPIGTTGGMPGTTGFTMACFHADKVPIGSKLYALPGAKGESE